MSDRRKSPVVPLVIAVVAAVITTGMLVNSWGSRPVPGRARVDLLPHRGQLRPVRGHRPPRARATRWRKGSTDAPVVMVAYSDFQCPFCGKFARDTEPILVKKYVDDGTLRIEWRDFPYLGKESDRRPRPAAPPPSRASSGSSTTRCTPTSCRPTAAASTRTTSPGWRERTRPGRRPLPNDMDADETRVIVGRDFKEGQAIGVTGTPAFLVNGSPVMGAQPDRGLRDDRSSRRPRRPADERGRPRSRRSQRACSPCCRRAARCCCPSFFAYAFASTRALVARTLVFYLGLVLTLVPLGTGAGAASSLFYGHRAAADRASPAGRSSRSGSRRSWAEASRSRSPRRSAPPWRPRGGDAAGSRPSLLGAVYGLAGFCSGPVLGAILTVAATQGTPWQGGCPAGRLRAGHGGAAASCSPRCGTASTSAAGAGCAAGCSRSGRCASTRPRSCPASCSSPSASSSCATTGPPASSAVRSRGHHRPRVRRTAGSGALDRARPRLGRPARGPGGRARRRRAPAPRPAGPVTTATARTAGTRSCAPSPRCSARTDRRG